MFAMQNQVKLKRQNQVELKKRRQSILNHVELKPLHLEQNSTTEIDLLYSTCQS